MLFLNPMPNVTGGNLTTAAIATWPTAREKKICIVSQRGYLMGVPGGAVLGIRARIAGVWSPETWSATLRSAERCNVDIQSQCYMQRSSTPQQSCGTTNLWTLQLGMVIGATSWSRCSRLYLTLLPTHRRHLGSNRLPQS